MDGERLSCYSALGERQGPRSPSVLAGSDHQRREWRCAEGARSRVSVPGRGLRGAGQWEELQWGKMGPHQCPRRWTLCDDKAPLWFFLSKAAKILSLAPRECGADIHPHPQPLLNHTSETVQSYTENILLPGGRISSQVPCGQKGPPFHNCFAYHLQMPCSLNICWMKPLDVLDPLTPYGCSPGHHSLPAELGAGLPHPIKRDPPPR